MRVKHNGQWFIIDNVGKRQYSTDGNNTPLGELFNNALDASGNNSHAEGENTTASGECSHAEGSYTTASGMYSHAEGYTTSASGDYSHAEGYMTSASMPGSHAEGDSTDASNYASHAEGYGTTASGVYSHAEGLNTIASGETQHVQGQFNIIDGDSIYAHIVGNGDEDTRSNAHTLDWNGNAWYQGEVRIGGTNYDDGVKLLTESGTVDISANLSNGWVPYNSDFLLKLVSVGNIVSISGVIKGGTKTKNTVLFSVPTECKPSYPQQAIICHGDGTTQLVGIHVNGDVAITNSDFVNNSEVTINITYNI